MSIYGPPVPAGPAGSEPGSPSPGPGGPAGGPGGGSGGSRWRRPRLLAALVAVAAVTALAAGGSWATGTPALRVLTTAQTTAKVSPALVDINTTLGLQHGSAAGTGIVLTPTGEILTNNHVIEGATSITVTDVGNGRSYRAKVVGYDERADVAVLQLRGASGLAAARLGDAAGVQAGQRVVALGNAGGRGGAPSVVTGEVTGLGVDIVATDQATASSEQLTGMIRTNAGIQPGDSGGALVNQAGQVIGMNTAASGGYQLHSHQPASRDRIQAFAIPAGAAGRIAGQIAAHRASSTVHLGTTAFLGVGLTKTKGSGAGVVQVLTGSPAAGAGLAPGDVLRSVGGHTITSPDDVQSTLVRYHPGDRVSLTWTSQLGQSHSATVTLVTGPAG